MEDLTKHQLILITLLISFVTSIATGIITFTLLQEAPVEVTQTINRVVERTIEKVVPVEGSPERVVETVVVNEEDRVLEAIAKNEKSIVRLKTTGADGTEIVVGLGVVLSGDGVIVSDLRNYSSGSNYSLEFFDGKRYSALDKVFIDNINGLVFLKTSIPKNEAPKYVFYSADLSNSDNLKIGQSLVAISGRESNAVAIGRIQQLVSSEASVSTIISDIPASRGSFGSPALNLSGEIIGLESSLPFGETGLHYMPINKVKSALPLALAELNK